ncbi:MAG TPA: NAD-dependent epimerase/dehydratase family protein [Candidatus Eisenbacteria bacterium]|nr:NAD-dependent epimerase/dehydratase family protein [Candidatus Eisenbacteria bacterium]
MSAERVLITGGAGFIGSHLADHLLARGHRVRALDSLVPQVHGESGTRPSYLHPDVELLTGDVRDPVVVRRALTGVDSVVHLAARVGVGQSMYQIAEYVSANDMGSAVLLEAIAAHPVRRLVTASSMSVYGEGLYADPAGNPVEHAERGLESLRRGEWEVTDSGGSPLRPVPTPETKRPALSSVYALTKYDQERLALLIGSAYGVPSIALRLFNVYGTRQALSNPYTGVLAIFAARLLNGKPPVVFEDGLQRRDFVHVADVARAIRLALEAPETVSGVFNVGSGASVTVLEIAGRLAEALGRTGPDPEITGQYRVGDIRHCFADITKAREVLGYEPETPMDRGLEDLARWLEREQASDLVSEAREELATRGLTF